MIADTAVLAADVTTTSTVLADLTGMTLSLDSGVTYRFEFFLLHQSTAGPAFAFSGSSISLISADAKGQRGLSAQPVFNNGWITSIGDSVSFGSKDNTHVYMTTIKGTVKGSAATTLQLQYALRIALGSITMKAGSTGILYRVNLG